MNVVSDVEDTAHRDGGGAERDDFVIEVHHLRMRYGVKDVLTDVDFMARRGEVLVLLGPNGAGKTTIVEILEGFRLPSAGEVRVLGVSPASGDARWRADVGIVLQSWRDHGKWRVRELLDHLGRYYVAYSTPQRPRPFGTDELISAVGLEPQAAQRVASLSGGQRRRLDVAIGIVGRPRVLFLDEPTAGFDPEARRDFHDLVHHMADLEDTTVMMTTHDLDEAEKLADRILILAGGRIVADGSADELARAVSARAEVRWSHNGEHFVHPTSDATNFVSDLFLEHPGEITDLEVRRATLEDTYMAMVHRHETGHPRKAALRFVEGDR